MRKQGDLRPGYGSRTLTQDSKKAARALALVKKGGVMELFQELGVFLPVPFDGAPEIGYLPVVMHDLG